MSDSNASSNRAHAFDARVVDEDVDGPQLGFGAPHELGPVGRLRYVALDGNGTHAQCLHLGSHRLEFGGRPGGQREVHTLLGQRPGDVDTDAT